MIPRTFKVDGDGDLNIEFGLRLTDTLTEFVAQKLDENLNFWLGEWFLDTRLGLPMFGRVIGQRYDRRLVDHLFRRAAELTTGVGSAQVRSEFDRHTRVLVVGGLARTVQGEDIPLKLEFVV